MRSKLKPIRSSRIHSIKNIILLNPSLQKIQTIPIRQLRYHQPKRKRSTYNICRQTSHSSKNIDMVPRIRLPPEMATEHVTFTLYHIFHLGDVAGGKHT
jgi:hypothetical protein